MITTSNLISLFEENRNDVNAGPMMSYMKNHFPFLGIKTPLRKTLMKQYYQETLLLKEPFQSQFVYSLWELEEREYHYAALDYVERSVKKLQKEDFSLIEYLITTKSWWDTVDMLASKMVGYFVMKYPELIGEKIEHFAVSNDMWLRRTAILFQLKYKEETNEELLYRYILMNAESKEFFIQKAIGWALREYSKTNPSSVKNFINQNKLAKLSVREGSKYIN